MTTNQPRQDQIFDEVIQIADPIQRARKIDDLCGNDRQLRDEILDLVNRDQQMGSFLENPPTAIRPDAEDTTPDGESTPVPVITNYRLLEVIGVGGMGKVWRAEQEKPVRREVAVKLIRSETNARRIISRFEAERQALAMMDHPNIARVLGAGTTDAGAPYFVMELVRGVPLNQYCDQNRLDIQQRLELFVQVCKAVEHAHQKGIIHRDLKPTNVLVEQADGEPVAKVIDFGLAKAIEGEQKLTEESLHTEVGRVIGTLQYMSPEQATLNSKDIDTRTDIYSLGVILFELLTGSTPLKRELVREMNLLDVLERLQTTEPVRPSVRVDSSTDTISEITRHRQISPSRLQQILRGELDCIVTKALESDRDLRYETASSFSDDVLRYLNHEPVYARPQSSGYRLQKFVQKHRGLVTASSVILALLIAGIAGTGYGFYRASQNAESERIAKEDALNQKSIADQKTKEAQTAAEQATESAKRSSDALKIFASAFQSADPAVGADSKMTAVDVLNRAKQNLDSSELDEVGRIVLLNALSRSFLGQSDFASAIETGTEASELSEQLFGRNHTDTMDSLNNLALAHDSNGEYEKAIRIYDEILSEQTNRFGVEDQRTLTTLNNLGVALMAGGKYLEAEGILEKTLKTRMSTLGENDHRTATTMSNLGEAYRLNGEYQKAIETLGESVSLLKSTLAKDHPTTFQAESNLGLAQLQNGDIHDAIELYRELLDRAQSKFGPDHRETIVITSNLASALQTAGKIGDSVPLLEQVKGSLEKSNGLLNPDTLIAMNNLALAYSRSGRLDEAMLLFKECLDLTIQVQSEDHPDTDQAMNNLAGGYTMTGENEKAIELFRQVLEKREARYGADHPETINSRINVAFGLTRNNRHEEAMEMNQVTLNLAESTLGPTNPLTLRLIGNLATTHYRLKEFDQSIPLFERQVELNKKIYGAQSRETFVSLANLGVNYKDSGELEKSIPHLEAATKASQQMPGLAWIRKHLRTAYLDTKRLPEFKTMVDEELAFAAKEYGEDSSEMAGARVRIGWDLIKIGDPVTAESLLQMGWEYRHHHDPDSWLTFNAQSLLGEALLDQGEHESAANVLVDGYEGLQKTADQIPETIRETKLSEALDRVIRISRETGDDQLLEKYESANDDG